MRHIIIRLSNFNTWFLKTTISTQNSILSIMTTTKCAPIFANIWSRMILNQNMQFLLMKNVNLHWPDSKKFAMKILCLSEISPTIHIEFLPPTSLWTRIFNSKNMKISIDKKFILTNSAPFFGVLNFSRFLPGKSVRIRFEKIKIPNFGDDRSSNHHQNDCSV